MSLPIIDVEKCVGCGTCVSVCTCGALKLAKGAVKASVVKECTCGWCAVCELVCPHSAISCPFEVTFEQKPD